MTVITFGETVQALEGVHVIPLRIHYPLGGSFFRQFDLFLAVLKNIRPDTVVYAQEPVVVGFAVRWACALKRVPYFLKFVGDSAWERAFFSGKTRKLLDDFLKSPEGGLVSKLLIRIQKSVFHHARKVIVPSHYLKSIVHRFYNIPESTIEVVVNALDLELIKKIPVSKERDRTLITVGRLVRWKNIAGVIRAFSRIEDESLLLKIIGSGPQLHELKQLALSLGIIERVHFLGSLSHSQTLQEIAKSTGFILNSVYEGLPHTVLEAMALKTPVIATDIPGTSEVAQSETTALTVPIQDDSVLTSTMKRLLSDSGLRSRLAEHAYAFVMKHHVWTDQLKRLEMILQLRNHRRLLMLSNDLSLLRPAGEAQGDTFKRFQRYAEYVDELIVLIPVQKTKFYPIGEKNLKLIPCYGKSYFRFLALWKMAKRLSRENPFALIVTNDAILGWIATKLRKRFGGKVQINVFGLEIFNPDWLKQRFLNRILAKMEKRALIRADEIRSDTLVAKNLLIKHLGIKSERITVIPVAPSSEMIEKFRKARPDVTLKTRYPDSFLILSVTGFEPSKNIPLLIEAAALLKAQNAPSFSFRWFVVGGGPQENQMRSLIKKNDLEKEVILLGKLPYDDLISLYASCDLFVLTSLHEGFPRVIMEAAFAKLPVITTNGVFGACDVIRNGENGFLVENKNAHALASTILKVYFLPDRGKALGDRLHQYLLDYCDFEKCLKALVSSWN